MHARIQSTRVWKIIQDFGLLKLAVNFMQGDKVLTPGSAQEIVSAFPDMQN